MVYLKLKCFQFGTDQLQFKEFCLSLLYMNYTLVVFILLMASSITAIVYNNTIYFTFTCLFGYGVVIVSLQSCPFVVSNITWLLSHFNTIILSRVKRYPLIHKQLERRSAFTYRVFSPSILDLAM